MHVTTTDPVLSEARGTDDPRLARLGGLIEHASHLRPAQGPITVFFHHNTLDAFEDLPFDEAVKKMAGRPEPFGRQT